MAARVRALVGGARGPGFVQRAAQRFVLRVRHYRDIGGLIQAQQPAVEVFLLSPLPRLLDDRLVEPAQVVWIGNVVRPAVRRIQYVLFELRLQLRELQHHVLEAALAFGVQADAGEAEVSQRMFHHALFHRPERIPLAPGNALICAIQRLALGEIRLVRGEKRQAGVVARAQLLGIEDRVQMADRRPDPGHAVLELFERLHDITEGGVSQRGQLVDAGPVGGQHFPNGWLDMFGPDGRELRQRGVREERVFHGAST